MFQIFKKAIAFMLSSVMLFSGAGIAAQTEENEEVLLRAEKTAAVNYSEKCEYPVVIVPGINHSPTYLCDENGNALKSSDGSEIGGTLLIFNNDILKKELPKLALPLVGSLLAQRDTGLTEKAYEVCKNVFSVQQTDSEGNTVNNLITKRFDYPVSQMSEEDKEWFYQMLPVQKLSDVIGEENIFLYTFNLVGNPMDSAKELDDYIDMVKSLTGKEKVILLNVSLGGTIFTAYVDEYGYDDIHQVVNVVAATDGTDIVADMMMRSFNLTDEYFYNDFVAMIAEENMGDIAYGYLINVALRIFPKEVLQTLITRVMDALLETIMINSPQLWALVPSARYDEVAGKYLSDGSKPVLKAKLDRYHEAQLNLKENVLRAKEEGVRIDNICGSDLCYGEDEYTFFNIVKSASTVNGDGIIPLYSSGMGAKGADRGTVLTQYNEKYTNRARTVDLSTSYLPDNTWVFEKQHHEVGNNSVVLNLAKDIIIDPDSLPNNSAPGNKYPMFNGTQYDKKIRKWRLAEAEQVDISLLSPEDADRLQKAVDEAKAVLSSPVADNERAQAATDNLTDILISLGVLDEPKKESALMPFIRKCTKALSEKLVEVYGANGFSDGTLKWNEFKGKIGLSR